MLDCLCKKTTMTVNEFLQLERQEITLDGIQFNKIRKNKKLEKFMTVFIASALYAKKVLAVNKNNKSGIDVLGWKLLGIIREWSYWILIMMCIVEIIRCATSGEVKSIYKVIIKFALIFASMYLIPELFDTIAESF